MWIFSYFYLLNFPKTNFSLHFSMQSLYCKHNFVVSTFYFWYKYSFSFFVLMCVYKTYKTIKYILMCKGKIKEYSFLFKRVNIYCCSEKRDILKCNLENCVYYWVFMYSDYYVLLFYENDFKFIVIFFFFFLFIKPWLLPLLSLYCMFFGSSCRCILTVAILKVFFLFLQLIIKFKICCFKFRQICNLQSTCFRASDKDKLFCTEPCERKKSTS